MKQTLLRTIVGAGGFLLCLAPMNAAPQYPDRDPWHNDRESFYHEQSWHMHLFNRVRQDLDHVQTVAFSGGDEYRIVRTKRELDELQSKLAAGEYDESSLDDAISALGRVVTDNRLSARDRDMLNDDLNRMRDYRAHHSDWR